MIKIVKMNDIRLQVLNELLQFPILTKGENIVG